jgi:hypothetical protein
MKQARGCHISRRPFAPAGLSGMPPLTGLPLQSAGVASALVSVALWSQSFEERRSEKCYLRSG